VWRAGGCFPLTGVLGVRPPQRTASVYTFFQDLRNTLYRSGSVDARLGLTSVTRSEKLTAYGVY
jgi:hypothetical protein